MDNNSEKKQESSSPIKEVTLLVAEIGQIHFEGNVIPHSWYQHITTDTETHKVYPLAIFILAEIIYWYKPVEIMDESTGKLIGYRRKFNADLWQISHDALAEKLGATKRQIKYALLRLENLKLIKKSFRHGIKSGNLTINNVMYLEPIPENIKRITGPHATEKGHLTKFRHLPDEISSGASRKNVNYPTVKRHTNTEISTETPSSLSMIERKDLEKLIIKLFPSVSALSEKIPTEKLWLFLYKIRRGEIQPDKINSPLAYMIKMVDEDISLLREKEIEEKKHKAAELEKKREKKKEEETFLKERREMPAEVREFYSKL